MSLRIDVDSGDVMLQDLWQWLSSERELRGRVSLRSKPTLSNEMGSGTEIALQAAGLAIAALGTLLSLFQADLAGQGGYGQAGDR